jgi:hypothetical protein
MGSAVQRKKLTKVRKLVNPHRVTIVIEGKRATAEGRWVAFGPTPDLTFVRRYSVQPCQIPKFLNSGFPMKLSRFLRSIPRISGAGGTLSMRTGKL